MTTTTSAPRRTPTWALVAVQHECALDDARHAAACLYATQADDGMSTKAIAAAVSAAGYNIVQTTVQRRINALRRAASRLGVDRDKVSVIEFAHEYARLNRRKGGKVDGSTPKVGRNRGTGEPKDPTESFVKAMQRAELACVTMELDVFGLTDEERQVVRTAAEATAKAVRRIIDAT